MRTFDKRQTPKQWVRLAMKFGLLATDPKFWSEVNEDLSERVENVGDAVREKYDTAADRLHDAHHALRGDNNSIAPALSFLGGIAAGVGLGILLAPSSGEETRATLREKAVNLKDKVSDIGRHYQSRGSDAARATTGD